MNYGLMLKPSNTLDLNCYVDADFAVLWSHEDKLDPTSNKSCMGFAICLANCAIVRTSKLQRHILMSTMEIEYSALSHSMKTLLPLRELLTIIAKCICLEDNYTAMFARALMLANMEPDQITQISKYYAVRMHSFCSHLNE